MTFQIYLDMDGVLADFDSAMQEAVGEDKAQLNEKLTNLGLEHLTRLDWLELKQIFAGEQPNLEMAQAKKLYNRFRSKQYAIMGTKGWFLNLEPLPWAEELIVSVGEIHRRENDKLPHILTAPVQSEFCKPEKEMWMKTHFPDMYNEFFCRNDKHRHADDFSILVDDNLKYVEPFVANGGHAVHFKGDLEHSIRELEEIISSHF